jgi:hypothetical protein
MHHQDQAGRNALSGRGPIDGDPPARELRDLTPPDGSVGGWGDLVCVYCAPCQRWIDCYEGVPPEVARQRHGELFH